jgi:flagellar basal body P-ring formation protein FlgA
MMIYRGILSGALLSVSLAAWGQPFENTAELTKSAESQLVLMLADEYKGALPEQIKVQIRPLDPRTQLSRCDTELTQAVVSQRPYGSNVSLKLQCKGSTPWAIYLTAKVDVLTKVAVPKRNLERGQILTGEDFEFTSMHGAPLGYISDPQQIIGLELKRRLPLGSPIRRSHLKIAQAVSRGEKVTLEAGVTGVTVITHGRALGSGKIGQQIKVMNIGSNRIVDAEVVAPGRVRVFM